MFKKLNHALAIVLSLTMVISLFAGFPPKTQAGEAATYEELPAPPIRMPAAVNPDYPQMESPVVEGYSNGDGTGYLDVSWDPVEGAEKYQVILFNGTRHSYWDVPASETSWTTKGKGMFPTSDQIESGQVDFLRNSSGTEFVENPSTLYQKSHQLNGGLEYSSSDEYYVRLTAVLKDGALPISYASTETLSFGDAEEDWELEYESIQDVPSQIIDDIEYHVPEEVIPVPEDYLDPYHVDTIDTTHIAEESLDDALIAIPAGVYMVYMIGTVIVTTTGIVYLGGKAYKRGTWVYNKVSTYFTKKDADKAAKVVPNRVKKKGKSHEVDLSQFKDKFGNTPLKKSSGTFTNGTWVITKDTANHKGWNGDTKVWKLGNPHRKASLNNKGLIIDK